LVDKYGKDVDNIKPQPKHKVHVLRFHINVGDADRARQIDKAKEFLVKKNQVKVMLQLRGREKSRPQLGVDFLNEVLEELAPYGAAANPPRPDNLSATLNPKKQQG
jgi:translation initiation factor IF-3